MRKLFIIILSLFVFSSCGESGSDVCGGSMTPFGRNLAAVDEEWTNAIGYNNLSSFFRRGIKWATTD